LKKIIVPNDTYIIDSYLYSITNENDDKYSIERKYENGIFAFRTFKNPYIIDYSIVKEEEFSKNLSKDLNNIYLFNCYNGFCRITDGYLKYGSSNEVSRCNSNSCNNSASKSFTTCDFNNKEIAYYDTSISKFRICVETKFAYEFINILPDFPVNYIIPYNKMYLFDKGANIIGELSQGNLIYKYI